MIYYYKHHNVLQLFAKSDIDFASSKHLFNHHIYQLASAHNSADSLAILSGYFKLFMLSNSEVAAEQDQSDDLDFNKILGLKQSSNNQMEFSKESHQTKLKMLVKSFNKYILKQIVNPHMNDQVVISHLGLFEILAH